MNNGFVDVNMKNMVVHGAMLAFQLVIVVLEVIPQSLTQSIYLGLQITETLTELVI